ncbi:MAG: BBP7 family outer membrane beta-barrel protein [Planctomycetaceae bacterium]
MAMMPCRLTYLCVVLVALAAASGGYGQEFPGSNSRFVPQQGNGMWPPYGGYAPPMTDDYQGFAGGGESPAYGWGGGQSGPVMVQERLPSRAERGPLYEDSHWDGFKNVLSQTTVRIEYLNWGLNHPDPGLMGAPLTNWNANTQPFTALDRSATIRVDPNNVFNTITAFTPILNFTSMRDINGVRGTIGIPTMYGQMELSAFGLQRTTQELNIAPVANVALGTLHIPAVTLLLEGQGAFALENAPNALVLAPMILFDTSFKAEYQTRLMGAGVDFIGDAWTPNAAVEMRSVFGVKYTRLGESLTISGVDQFTDTDPTNDTTHFIRSESLNHIFGPSIGFRAQTQIKNLTLGVTPKFILGFNRHEDSVQTRQIFDAAEAQTFNQRNHSEIAPMFELQAFASLQMSDNFRLRAGYDLNAVSGISRPDQNINYNDSNLVGNPTIIGLKSGNLKALVFQGFSVSAEWTLY